VSKDKEKNQDVSLHLPNLPYSLLPPFLNSLLQILPLTLGQDFSPIRLDVFIALEFLELDVMLSKG
jgi:hypothetical protein